MACDASRLPADLSSVDYLARCRLAAQRDGSRLTVHGVSAELRELLELAGLGELLTD
ncbi:MAG: STAS domain-containing protein [Frankiales bacterium]|nr:STAS domain-containing protein [Frankiales bacterium]